METTRQDYEIRTALFTVADRGQFLLQLRRIMQTHDATIICFNAMSMAGLPHAHAAIAHAIRSFYSGSPIAKTLEMEALLYAAGTRQCSDAGAFGIHDGENSAYVCCCPPRTEVWDTLLPLMRFVDDRGEPLDPSRVQTLKRLFSISDEELFAAGGAGRLQDLVIERVALLDAYK